MPERAKAAAELDINARIAARVRSLRAELGMTLDALASKSGVSRSMLSLLERGESSATAMVLEKVATGLSIPLASLFDDQSADPSPLSRREDRETWRDPKSGYLRRSLSPANFSSALHLTEIVLPPGAHVAYENGGYEMSIHQQVWVLEGALELTVDGVVYPLHEDDCLAMQLDRPTAFRNRTKKPARYLVVISTGRTRTARR